MGPRLRGDDSTYYLRHSSSSGIAKSSQPGTSATSENGLPNGRVASMPMQEAVRNGRALVGSSIDGSDGPDGSCSTMIASCCGWVRKASAHSTSEELCTSISGSTTMVHFGRMLLAMAAKMT